MITSVGFRSQKSKEFRPGAMNSEMKLNKHFTAQSGFQGVSNYSSLINIPGCVEIASSVTMQTSGLYYQRIYNKNMSTPVFR